mgnify:CR=1 FL=1
MVAHSNHSFKQWAVVSFSRFTQQRNMLIWPVTCTKLHLGAMVIFIAIWRKCEICESDSCAILYIKILEGGGWIYCVFWSGIYSTHSHNPAQVSSWEFTVSALITTNSVAYKNCPTIQVCRWAHVARCDSVFVSYSGTVGSYPTVDNLHIVFKVWWKFEFFFQILGLRKLFSQPSVEYDISRTNDSQQYIVKT